MNNIEVLFNTTEYLVRDIDKKKFYRTDSELVYVSLSQKIYRGGFKVYRKLNLDVT